MTNSILPQHGLGWLGRLGWRAVLVALLTLLLASASGCQIRVGGTGRLGKEMDELRLENMNLQRRVDRLEDQLQQRQGQIHALEQQLKRAKVEIEGADVPVFSRLRFGRHSGAVDTTRDGWADSVRLYARTEDQHGRMLPVSGRARLRVSWLDDEDEPELLAERSYEPDELDQAYRDGLAGTHYRLQVALPEDLAKQLPAGEQNLTVRASVLDAATGARHTRQQVMPIEVQPD